MTAVSGVAWLQRIARNKLIVPANQRDYAWTDQEVTRLFQDLAKAKSDNADYFLGAVVTISGKGETLEVVDGQQRLATTAILLAAFRDHLRDNNEDVLVESINNEFLTSIDRSSRARVPNLKLNVDDNDLFRRIVVSELDNIESYATRVSQQLILSAYKLAQAHVRYVVSALDAKDHGDIINDWVSFIENNALVVLMRVPDTADAYKMFETLNARGLETSQADLIKNYLFGRSAERLTEVQNRWGLMRGALEALDDNDITVTFLRHALITVYGFLRESEVFDTVEDKVKSAQAAVTFATVLENLATIYVATFNPQHERWIGYPFEVRRSIEVFNLFNIRPMRPLLVAVSDKMTPKETAAAFKFLISLGVRLMIASSTRSGTVETALAVAAHKVFDGALKTAAQLKVELDPVTPSDETFSDAFSITKVSNQRLARYYLRSLEMAAKDENEPWFVPQESGIIITLEHILPRKPEGNWPSFTDDEAKNYATRLGNLVLLRASNNSRLGSNEFSIKKAVYGQSPYVLTSMINEESDWTPETVNARQSKLAILALKAWPRSLQTLRCPR